MFYISSLEDILHLLETYSQGLEDKKEPTHPLEGILFNGTCQISLLFNKQNLFSSQVAVHFSRHPLQLGAAITEFQLMNVSRSITRPYQACL